jgi:hypothetical protein
MFSGKGVKVLGVNFQEQDETDPRLALFCQPFSISIPLQNYSFLTLFCFSHKRSFTLLFFCSVNEKNHIRHYS